MCIAKNILYNCKAIDLIKQHSEGQKKMAQSEAEVRAQIIWISSKIYVQWNHPQYNLTVKTHLAQPR